MKIENPLGQWLKSRRAALDLTQEKLAELVGCAPITVRMIESGKRRPSRQLAAQLAAQLQLAPQDGARFVDLARLAGAESGASAPPAAQQALETAAHRSLPLQLSSFIGREDETEGICRLLRSDARLLTLSGPPGIGKTRLSLHVAAMLADDFGDGVFFVPLAAIGDPQLVVSAIAAAVQVRSSPDQTLPESLKAYLQDKHCLLLLDNFEQLLAAVALVADLLAAAAGLKIVVTSRSLLHLYGEYEFVVPPLGLPDNAALADADQLAHYPAVALFVRRAQAANSRFALSPQNSAAVAEICIRLDGLPLAIELAAARVKLFAPQAILARLDSRLLLLTGGPSDLPPRQQTLRGAISWSYDLLSADERAIFRCVAVFVDGFTADAAAAVCDYFAVAGAAEHAARSDGSAHQYAALDALAMLINQSLLKREETPDGEPRFRMLETIHEYGLERLAADGTAQEIYRRSAEYYLQLAEHAEPQLTGTDQVTWLARLESEHENLRAVLRRLFDGGELALAARLAAALWRFWWTHGHGGEGRRWMELILDAVAADEVGDGVPARVRLKLTRGAGILERDQGNYTRAEALLAQSLRLSQGLGDRQAMADTLNSLGLLSAHQANYIRARSCFEESLAIFRELESRPGMAKVMSNLAEMLREQGEHGDARLLMNKTLLLNRELGNKRGVADALNSLGLLALYARSFAEAQACLEEAQALYHELGVRLGIANTMCNLGDVALNGGDFAGAELLMRQALAIHRERGDKRYVAGVLISLSQLKLLQLRGAEARELAAESLRICYALGNNRGVADCLVSLAGAELIAVAAEPELAVEAARRSIWLCSTVARLLGEMTARLDPTTLASYDHALASATGLLNKQDCLETWQAAQVAPLQDTIAMLASA